MSIKSPNRHSAVMKKAFTLALQILDHESPEPVRELVRQLSDFNERECEPPKPREYVESIAESTMAYMMNALGEA